MDKKSIGLIGVFALLLLAGVFFYIGGLKRTSLDSGKPEAETQRMDTQKTDSTDKGTASATLAEWKTYTNNRYGYSIKYSDKWYVDSLNSEDDFKQGVDGRYSSSGETLWSNYLFDSYTEVPSDLQVINLTLYRSDESLNDFFDRYYNNPDIKATDKIASKIQGRDMIRYSFAEERTSGEMAFIKTSTDNIMVFGTTKESGVTLDLMLASLAFTK